jgi:hypothetical protein
MSQDKSKRKRDIGAVIDFALDTSELTNEEILDELSENGINVDIAIPKILTDINKKMYGKSWTDIAFENKARMCSLGKEISEKLAYEKGEFLEKIKEIISSGQIQLQYRDYKDLTEEDLRSLLEDAEFLRKLDESKRKS